MTEKEFLNQVWRPYDTVEVEGGFRGSVSNVCFPSRSVKVRMNDNTYEWFNCDLIVSHKSNRGCADDSQYVNELEEKIEEMRKKLNTKSDTIEKQNIKILQINADMEKLKRNSMVSELRKALNNLESVTRYNKHMIASLEEVDSLVSKMEESENESE